MTVPPRLDAIFAAAIELPTPGERLAYIAQACQGDEALRQQLEQLVCAHFEAGTFLDDGVAGLEWAVDQLGADSQMPRSGNPDSNEQLSLDDATVAKRRTDSDEKVN